MKLLSQCLGTQKLIFSFGLCIFSSPWFSISSSPPGATSTRPPRLLVRASLSRVLLVWSIFLHFLCALHPRLPGANTMPRLRGKSKRGAAWYAARGRVAPNSGSPLETDGIPILNPVEAPTPAQPFRETTPDLSPLSNPYACRIEWFDNFGQFAWLRASSPLPSSSSSTSAFSPSPPSSSTSKSLPLLPPFVPPPPLTLHCPPAPFNL
jgi:hypothetical protein